VREPGLSDSGLDPTAGLAGLGSSHLVVAMQALQFQYGPVHAGERISPATMVRGTRDLP